VADNGGAQGIALGIVDRLRQIDAVDFSADGGL
jgi:hypothetical protein